MTAVYKKELKSYFTGMTGPIFIVFLLVMIGIFTTLINLRSFYPSFEITLANLSLILALSVPVITMRSVAEEKHSKTDQLLYSLPISMTSIVMAKFLAMATVLLIPIGIMAFYPLILASFGTVSFPTAYSMLLAVFLLGTTLISIGLFISSLTESQVISAVVTLGVMFLFYFMSSIAYMIPTDALASLIGLIAVAVIAGVVIFMMIKNPVISGIVSAVLIAASVLVYFISPALLEGLIPNILYSVSIFDKLYSFESGMLDLGAIFFFISTAALFVFLTVQSMEKKRWN